MDNNNLFLIQVRMITLGKHFFISASTCVSGTAVSLHLKINIWMKEMTMGRREGSLVSCLPHRQEDPGSIPRNHRKAGLGVWWSPDAAFVWEGLGDVALKLGGVSVGVGFEKNC